MDEKTRNMGDYPPPKLLLIYHTLLMLEIQRSIQDLIRKVCERVLGIVHDLCEEVDILVGLLDETLISER